MLVTGAFGFIGSHLVPALVGAGARVTALGRPGGVADRPGVAFAPEVERVALDLDGAALPSFVEDRTPGWIFHLAGHRSVGSSFHEPQEDLRDNAASTLGVLEAARACEEPPIVVFASSAAVYGSGSPDPLHEDEPANPSSPYGASKRCAEAYASIYAREYGIPTVGARLFPLFGPGQRRHVLYDLMKKLTRDPGRLEVVGDGHQTRDLLYVDDCVEGLLLLGTRGSQRGGIFNLSSGIVVTIRQLVAALCRHMGLEPAVQYTGDFRAGGGDDWVADLARIREIGYSPGYGLDRGLERTLDWFRRIEVTRLEMGS